LCYIPDECQSVGASLGDVCIEEIKKDLPSDHEQFVFAVSCVANAFDRLRRVSENDQFVSVCVHAYRWCLGEAINQVRLCLDQPAAMDIVSTVTGIVDLDPLHLERCQHAMFRARTEQEVALFAAWCYHHDVDWGGGVGRSCIKDLETSESLGSRLGESVVEKFDDRFSSTEAYVRAFSCFSNAFAQLGRTSDDSQFVTVCAHARCWCIGRAKLFVGMESIQVVSGWRPLALVDDQFAAVEVVSRVTGIVDFAETALASMEVVGEVTDIVDLDDVVSPKGASLGCAPSRSLALGSPETARDADGLDMQRSAAQGSGSGSSLLDLENDAVMWNLFSGDGSLQSGSSGGMPVEVEHSSIIDVAASAEGHLFPDASHVDSGARPSTPNVKATAKARRRRTHITQHDPEAQPVRRSARIALRSNASGALTS